MVRATLQDVAFILTTEVLGCGSQVKSRVLCCFLFTSFGANFFEPQPVSMIKT